jgi:hypothetical protein
MGEAVANPNGTLLLAFIGRKSGRRYAFPVFYVMDGDYVLILTRRSRAWWENFSTPWPVEVELTNRFFTGSAEALTQGAVMERAVATFLQYHPRAARFFDVEAGADNRPNIVQVRRMAGQLVVIRVQPG